MALQHLPSSFQTLPSTGAEGSLLFCAYDVPLIQVAFVAQFCCPGVTAPASSRWGAEVG